MHEAAAREADTWSLLPRATLRTVGLISRCSHPTLMRTLHLCPGLSRITRLYAGYLGIYAHLAELIFRFLCQGCRPHDRRLQRCMWPTFVPVLGSPGQGWLWLPGCWWQPSYRLYCAHQQPWHRVTSQPAGNQQSRLHSSTCCSLIITRGVTLTWHVSVGGK